MDKTTADTDVSTAKTALDAASGDNAAVRAAQAALDEALASKTTADGVVTDAKATLDKPLRRVGCQGRVGRV